MCKDIPPLGGHLSYKSIIVSSCRWPNTCPSGLRVLVVPAHTLQYELLRGSANGGRELFYMRKLMFLVALGVIGAGQMKADPLCTANTLAFYETNITTLANGCN